MTLADINKTPETWLGFYPHDSFVEILRELLKSLERREQDAVDHGRLWHRQEPRVAGSAKTVHGR